VVERAHTPVHRPPRFHDFFLVPHPAEPAVILLPDAQGWTLPNWVHDARRGRTGREHDDPFWPSAVQREVRRSMSLETTVLHAGLFDSRDADTGDRHSVIVLELQQSASAPPGSRWARRADLSHLPLAVPWHRATLARWFAETEAGEPAPPATSPARPPWQRSGWYATAAAWMAAQLRNFGAVPAGPAEQLGTKLGRYLLRVPTSAGIAYFKALPAMYAREPRLLRLLAATHPNRIPAVLAADPDRHWFITWDHGAPPLETVQDLGAWENALRAFSELQATWTSAETRQADLLEAGCPDLRLERLAERTTALLADRPALARGEAADPGEAGLSAAEIHDLHAVAPWLRAACDRLRHYGVPDGLVHGDFLPANVALGKRGPVFVDWCEASLSHPFFSAVRFLASAEWEGRPLREQPSVATRLRDAYLEPWSRYGSVDRLSRAFALAQALQPLHHALTYQHLWHLLAAESSAAHTWERRGVTAQSLRSFLRQRHAPPESCPSPALTITIEPPG